MESMGKDNNTGNSSTKDPNTYIDQLDIEDDGGEGNTLKCCEKPDRIYKRIYSILYVLLFLGYCVYVGFSVAHDAKGAIFVCTLGVVLLMLLSVKVLHLDIRKPISKLIKYVNWKCNLNTRRRMLLHRVVTVLVCLGLVSFLVVDIISDFNKLKPLGGLCFFILFLWITSTNRMKVIWTPVIWGVLLQFGLGIIILRWPPGYMACKFVGDCVSRFLDYTDEGSKFVFGETTYTLHVVAFKILPVVIYFSAVVSILYYLGILQGVIRVLAAILEYITQTTTIESFAAAAHIFIGQLESSVVLRPFLNDLTVSELHAVMTGGFATVAGTVIAAYIEFGVPAEHVISASFMSAPAALAVAKLSMPETEKTSINIKTVDLDVGKENNVMEAASVGATTAAKLVAYVIVNLIAIIALLAFLDAAMSYFGSRVGHPEVTFDFICSYVFMPLAVIMGIPWSHCRLVGKLIGKKILLNEFLAFADLGKHIKSGDIESRSMVIATYILCGFGSLAAMGINLGALSAAEPRRRTDFARVLFRSFVAGNIACFMTACVAGILYQDLSVHQDISNTTSYFNFTEPFNNTSNFTTAIP